MAITLADFNKIWAYSSPLTPYSFSDDNYNEGWNFIGQIPPSRQMWDFLQKNNDEKMQYLANNYLPLSGGTMTGDIAFSKTDFAIKASTDTNSNSLWGGTSWSKGSYLSLYGVDHASYPGWFRLYARDKVNNTSIELRGKPDGTLTWAGNTVLTTANGLPLSGGTMTGVITKAGGYLAGNTDNTSSLIITGGTNNSTGATLTLYGKNETTYSGRFTLSATDGTNTKYLVGRPDGTLNWDSDQIVTAKVGNFAIGKNVDDGFMQINGGTASAKGANLYLFGIDDATRSGYFRLVAKGTNDKTLEGKPDGTLTWDGNQVERVNASGSNYIRYESGLQICWDNLSVANPPTSQNYPQAFSSAPSVVVTPSGAINATAYIPKVGNVSSTSFTPAMSTTSNAYTTSPNYRYIAVGFWK